MKINLSKRVMETLSDSSKKYLLVWFPNNSGDYLTMDPAEEKVYRDILESAGLKVLSSSPEVESIEFEVEGTLSQLKKANYEKVLVSSNYLKGYGSAVSSTREYSTYEELYEASINGMIDHLEHLHMRWR